MPLTDGQRLAREQLDEIQRAEPGAVELLQFKGPGEGDTFASAEISIPCQDMTRVDGGLPLRHRERVRLFIPADFPYRPPKALVGHSRFAGQPHVQWVHSLCLYVAESTEWDPSDGMFGFLGRLESWFRLGALNQLDPSGEPLHPPVAYTKLNKLVIPRADTPPVKREPWLGLAHLRVVSERRTDVIGWSDLFAEDVPPTVGAAILLTEELPFEYPSRAEDLLDHLESHGLSRRAVLLTLAIAARRNRDGDPLYLLLGSPMRGVSGEQERQQHLTAWHFDAEMADRLRGVLEQFSTNEEIRAIGRKIETIMSDWLDLLEVDWVSIREDRPEVVTRRDGASPMSWFRGRTVAVWGCGALGAPVAEFLVRAGVAKIILHDNGIIAPGLLARQPFAEADIGSGKAAILGARLQQIRPYDLEVEADPRDLLNVLDDEDWTGGADAIIDAAAARAVVDKLEARCRETGLSAPVVSMVVDGRAERGAVVIAHRGHTGGPQDVLRRAKLAVCARPDLTHYADAFWPTEDGRLVFQPEPGCSDATFIGSAADSAALASALLNAAAVELSGANGATAAARLVVQQHVVLPQDQAREFSCKWGTDTVLAPDGSRYELRLAEPALKDIQAWIRRGQRENGFAVETGGVLFGERDDAAGVIWITEVLGPPPDSEQYPDLFICGVEGVAEANREKRERTRRSVQFIGMWHTHPDSPPVPSAKDLRGIHRLLSAERPSTPKPLLMIIRTDPRGRPPQIQTYVFADGKFESIEPWMDSTGAHGSH